MNFQRESASVVLSEGLDLFKDHWLEVTHNQDISLALDIERYTKADNHGLLRVYTVRSEAKKLIGYSVYFVASSTHYKNTINATQDSIYISPSYRGIGTEFIDYCDLQLQDEGIDIVYQNVTVHKDWSNALLRLGYKKIETIYSRRL